MIGAPLIGINGVLHLRSTPVPSLGQKLLIGRTTTMTTQT